MFKYSYSQFGEDIQIQRFVQGVRGLYLDIGSGHPIQGNNTYALYKDGGYYLAARIYPSSIYVIKK